MIGVPMLEMTMDFIEGKIKNVTSISELFKKYGFIVDEERIIDDDIHLDIHLPITEYDLTIIDPSAILAGTNPYKTKFTLTYDNYGGIINYVDPE